MLITKETDMVCCHGYRNQLLSSDNLDPHAPGWTNDSLTNTLQGYSSKRWVLRLDLGYLVDMSQRHFACLLVTFREEVEGWRVERWSNLLQCRLLLSSYLVSGLLLWCQQLLLGS